MKEMSLSSSTRALLEAAKSDGPGAAARMKMWGAVSTAAGIAAAAQGGAAGATAYGSTAAGVAAASSAKLLVAGAIFGSALTVGVALAVVRVVSGGQGLVPAGVERPVAAETQTARVDRNTSATVVTPGGADEAPPIPLAFSTLGVPQGAPWAAPPGDSPSAPAPARAKTAPSTSGVRPADEDPLWREESLILEAHGALRRGNPQAALASLDAAQRLGSHKLEPEELSVRAKTLRALGRDDDAEAVLSLLKTRYPDQAR